MTLEVKNRGISEVTKRTYVKPVAVAKRIARLPNVQEVSWSNSGILPLLHSCRKCDWLPCWLPRGQQVSHQQWIWGIGCAQASGLIKRTRVLQFFFIKRPVFQFFLCKISISPCCQYSVFTCSLPEFYMRMFFMANFLYCWIPSSNSRRICIIIQGVRGTHSSMCEVLECLLVRSYKYSFQQCIF